METTYSVEAKCNTASGMDVTFKGVGDIDVAINCAGTLLDAFPDVVVICEQTGEIMYSRYVSLEIFKPNIEMGKAIFNAECDILF